MSRRLELPGVVQKLIMLYVIGCPGTAIMCAIFFPAQRTDWMYQQQYLHDDTHILSPEGGGGGDTSVFRRRLLDFLVPVSADQSGMVPTEK